MRTQFICFVLAVILSCPFAHAQWVQSNGPFGMSTEAIAVRGRMVLAAGVSLYRSTDLGDHWNKVDTGPNEFHAIAIACNDSLFAATSKQGVWRRPLTEILAAADPEPGMAPLKFVLDRNYPNSFNPVTTIRYGLPGRSHVTLSVFNLLGQQVAVLQDGERDAGYHEAKFDGRNLASGLYFYRMQSGDFMQTRSLLILR